MLPEIDSWGHPVVRVATWDEVDNIPVAAGTRVIVGDGEGDFVWMNMWNPFANAWQMVRA